MNSAFAWQLVYSVIGLCSVSVAIRLYGSWAHAGGRSKLGLAFVLTCLTIDSVCGLIQTTVVQPHRWLLWILLPCFSLLVGLALRRTIQSFPGREHTPRSVADTTTETRETI